MKRILVIQAAAGPDYLADHLAHWLYLDDDLKLFTNRHPEYLFDDYPKSMPLSGGGFTVYRQIPHDRKQHITLLDAETITNNIREKLFDYIIWTSGRRCQDFLHEAVKIGYDKSKLNVVDGEDDIYGYTSPYYTYFKRELVNDSALPISFKFPSCHPMLNKPYIQKSRLLANIDPRWQNSYINGLEPTHVDYRYKEEEDYYRQYQESLFAFTTKKSGWDCMRHYEIIACNCLPVFPDFNSAPTNTMIEWDRNLQSRVNALWLHMSQVNSKIDIGECMNSWSELMEEFHQIFSTKMKTEHYKNTFRFDI
jgi:hypothetical protein